MQYHEITLSENWILYIYPFSDYVMLQYKTDDTRVRIDLDRSVLDDLLSGERVTKQIIPAITLDLNFKVSKQVYEELKRIVDEN